MNKQYPILYKRDSKGKILEWKIEVQNNGTQIDIMVVYGEFEGKKQLRWNRDIKSKNIGKSNETNAWEQACKDAKGKILRKKREGYKDIEDISNSSDRILQRVGTGDMYEITKIRGTTGNVVELKELLNLFLPATNTNLEGNLIPMKAQQYYRSKKNWTDPEGKLWKDRKYYYMIKPYATKETGSIITKFPTTIQPKINGVRCFAKVADGKVVLYSKKGLTYNIPQVTDFLNMNLDLFKFDDKELIFDGELYIEGEKLEVITSAVKATNLNTQRVKFIVFDIAVQNVEFHIRRKILKTGLAAIIDHIDPLNSPVEVLKTFKVKTDLAVQNLTDDFIKEGYEGSIMRDIDGLYQFDKRPQSMTKLKRLMDEEFTIIDIIPQEKDPNLGLFVCRTNKGVEFKVTPTGNLAYKADLLARKFNYLHKDLTCWFYEYTEAGIPFHIVDNIVRDYE